MLEERPYGAHHSKIDNLSIVKFICIKLKVKFTSKHKCSSHLFMNIQKHHRCKKEYSLPFQSDVKYATEHSLLLYFLPKYHVRCTTSCAKNKKRKKIGKDGRDKNGRIITKNVSFHPFEKKFPNRETAMKRIIDYGIRAVMHFPHTP